MNCRSKRKSRPVLKGLYQKHYIELSLPRAEIDALCARQGKAWAESIAARRQEKGLDAECAPLKDLFLVQSQNKYLNGYRSGPGTLEVNPTYQMNEKKFLAFVQRLEKAIFSLKTGRKSSLQNTANFFSDNSEVFHNLVDMSRLDGMVYFNLLFYPRPAKQQLIFRRFLNVYLEAISPRLNVQGPKSGTQAIPQNILCRAEAMRRAGKGTSAGSIEAIIEMVMKATGYVPDVGDIIQYSETIERRREATRKNLLRHFKRMGI